MLYQSNAALKAWYDDYLSIPSSSYYSFPIPVVLHVIHAVIMLGRWAKLSAPGTVRPLPNPLPPDPSGSWNNPPSFNSLTPTSSTSTGGGSAPSSLSDDNSSEIAHAIAALKVQLATQPGLSLDVTGTLDRMGSSVEQASAAMAAVSEDPPGMEHNLWSLTATKLRIAQLKLERWAEMVAEEEEEFDVEDEALDEDERGQGNEAHMGTGMYGEWAPNAARGSFDFMDTFSWMNGIDHWG